MADLTCPSCGAQLPAGSKFCSSCGSAIVLRTDERRVVTIVFADVVGFTPLSEDRDPEHVKNILDRCFERLAADVTSHGGRIDKIVGDEIMAVFGAPVAHEDDPERAVRAALQMQRTLAEHSEESGADVRMRIGINTGEVVVGHLRAGGDVTALGDVVNIAKRLQTSAAPGQVLVGPTTQLVTRDVIGYNSVGAIEIRGREAPVDTFEAVEALGPPGFRPGRIQTPLIGRKAELGMLWHALGTAVAHKRPHFVLIVGEAGVGKTRLVEETIEVARSQHDALVLQGRCLPYGEANPWWPVAEALRQACDIDPDDPADVAAGKCRVAVANALGTGGEGAEASRVADGLLYLMGYEATLHEVDPVRARDEAVRSVQLALAANARERPLLVVLSELHWADQIVLDLVDQMLERLRDLPIVLIATARAELYERWTPKPGRYDLHVLNLNPLDPKASGDLIRALMGAEPSPELTQLIIERGGGNPLFLEELVAILGESSLTTSGEGIELPATLRGLVSARLDSLDRAERAVLEDASVIGRRGPVAALEALTATRGETECAGRLSALGDKDLLVVDDDEYEFKSDLVRDVAYETLTKAERARRHGAVAKWLADYASRTKREEEHIERIAHHYAQTAQLVAEVGMVDGVPPDAVDRALDWLERATTRAELRETTGVSLHLLEHALALAPDEKARARFLLSRARGRTALRESEGAHEDLAAVLAIAEADDDEHLRAKVLTIRGELEQREGSLEVASASLEEAVALWRKIGDRRGEAEALRLWGYTYVHRGRLDEAEPAIAQALDISRELGDRRGEAWALQNLAWAAFTRGDNSLAEQRLLASSNLFEEIGDFGGQGWAYGLLGFVWFFQGHLDQAGVVAEGGVEWTREMGDRWARGMMLNLLSGVRLWQGRTKESEEHASEAYRLFLDIDDEMGLAFSTMGLASALTLLGKRERAEEVLASFPGWGPTKPSRFGVELAQSFIRNVMGDGAKALEAIASLESRDEPPALAARSLATLLSGDADEAYELASEAWANASDEPGDRANVACVFSLVAAAGGHPEEAIAIGDEVGRIGGTYLDQLRAHLGRGFGYAQLGDNERSSAAFTSARRIVDATDDAVHRALAQLAEATADRNDAAAAAARGRLSELRVNWQAWEQAFTLAATSAAGVTS